MVTPDRNPAAASNPAVATAGAAAPSPGVTRLAPSPTGALHLGNARTFLVTWALARRNGWRIVYRIEDLDGPRVKPEAAQAITDTFRWLGIDWDIGPTIQSDDFGPHRRAMAALAQTARAYPCDLTRSQIEAAASAPQEGSGEVRFPASLRPPVSARPFSDEHTNWRFVTPVGAVHFHDRFAGPHAIDPAAGIGDFVIWTKRGTPSYQLAVVVDDARAGVTEVIRGDDLLDSAARQLLLITALGLSPTPTYTHLPLVVGPDGRRLAKRHGDSRISAYRESGVPPEAVIGLCAHWCGLTGERIEPMTAAHFARSLNLATIPRSPVVFTPEQHQWLLSQNR
ncbi:MAG: glutamate--tRNA ligase family protein [Planctomycetaceae bacterium]|jgi:glutamyl-tRNA synthetase|nr:tRNA glutamyl-Q(34) synthetase GluQRS [Phycisphaerales bacterium]MCE2653848.1 glutamate--tRNA ligase family protein [Planctomycetaceae bacterium]